MQLFRKREQPNTKIDKVFDFERTVNRKGDNYPDEPNTKGSINEQANRHKQYPS